MQHTFSMKKVLILTYYWPPAGGAGVQRWLKFVKYLRRFGWEPVVYTVLNGEMPVVDPSLQKDVPEGITVLKQPIWEPYTLYKRFIGRKKEDRINAAFLNENRKTGLAEKISIWLRGNFFIPDARRFWIRPSISYLKQYLRDNGITHVISSGPPHSMHLIALGLKADQPSLRWLADFRDPWTNIDFYEKLMLTRAADRKHHRLEREVLLKADVVLSIGESMSLEFIGMYKDAGGLDTGKFHVITNGFDSDDLPREAVTRDAKFSLAHIGTLVKDRNPETLWTALAQLVKEQPAFAADLEIKLVGKLDIFVKDRIEAHGLSGYVRKIDYLPHNEVVREQACSKALLLLVNNTRNAKGILTGKVFEYMASRVPILAIGPPDGDLSAILRATRTGVICGFDDLEGLKQSILDYYNGKVPEPSENEVARYSRVELTRILAGLLG